MPPKEQDPSTLTNSVNDKKSYGSILPTVAERQSLIPPDSIRQTRRQTLGILLGGAVLIAVVILTLCRGQPEDEQSMGATYNHALVSRDGDAAVFATHPHRDLGLRAAQRADVAAPSPIWGEHLESPLPTNDWYMNLVSHHAHEAPDFTTRAYTTPYIIDTAADAGLAGIRMHWPVLKSSPHNVQLVDDYKNAVTLGTMAKDLQPSYVVDPDLPLSNLGVSLKWQGKSDDDDSDISDDISSDEDDSTTERLDEEISAPSVPFMKTSVVRGMPYGTMTYSNLLPSLFSFNAPKSPPVIDHGAAKLECGTLETVVVENDDGTSTATKRIVDGTVTTVQRELTLHVVNSDFTWMVFFSQPVQVECGVADVFDINTAEFQLNVVEIGDGTTDKDDDGSELQVRMALVDLCTSGESNIVEHCLERNAMKDKPGYIAMLRNFTQYSPTSPKIDIDYPTEPGSPAVVSFDWMPNMDDETSLSHERRNEFIMFALPHHQEKLQNDPHVKITDYCLPTFHGKTCLVVGKKWTLPHDIQSNPQSFTAPRPPTATMIPTLAKVLQKDINYRISDNLHRGAADTYFSGKILARVARTILIATELKQLAKGVEAAQALGYDDDDTDVEASIRAAESAKLPSDEKIGEALDSLKVAVQIWLENPEAPYVYDKSWGGMVNCGCNYTTANEHGHCSNVYPSCPALADVNQDFGNGFYNDHHFHYGYHVYAAAAVAKLDPKWAAAHFEEVLLYIRDFANPSEDDPYFINFRQKDWWLGSSWASGFVSAENSPHGRDQESSSEAIAAYEGVALFGQVMSSVFESSGASDEEKQAALLVQNAGELLTVTEVEAAERYWHVWNSDTHKSTYPETYERLTVGMLYDTMASFETWFSRHPVVSYGIQLMPFTPVAERRDDPEWAKLLYPEYKKSCKEAGDFCIDNGWSIVQAGLCATAGYREEALKQALAVPAKVFGTDGGMGNSLTNTVWFIATRK